jgi:hypothetical protein
LQSLLRIAKALGALAGCTATGAVAGMIAIILVNIALRRGEGFIGDGILYLMVDAFTTFIGLVVGLCFANDILFAEKKTA